MITKEVQSSCEADRVKPVWICMGLLAMGLIVLVAIYTVIVEAFAPVPAPYKIDVSPTAVTRVTDLEVTNQIQMTNASGPTVKTITSDPNTVVTEPRGSLRVRTDAANANLYLNTDGATAWRGILDVFTSTADGMVPASGGTTGSILQSNATWSARNIVITKAATGNTNLSTFGQFDWTFLSTAATNPGAQAPNTVHNKTLGGSIYTTWSWQSIGATAFTTAIGDTYSSNGGDDQFGAGSPLSTNTVAGFFTASGTLTGFGARFYVPAQSFDQVLRVYVYHFSSEVTVAARCGTDLTDVTETNDSAPAAGSSAIFIITFRCLQPTNLYVLAFVSANHGSSPNITIAGAALGPS